MSKLSRDKGLRAERAIVTAHADLGLAAERVALSRPRRYRGNGADVEHLDAHGTGVEWLLCADNSHSPDCNGAPRDSTLCRHFATRTPVKRVNKEVNFASFQDDAAAATYAHALAHRLKAA